MVVGAVGIEVGGGDDGRESSHHHYTRTDIGQRHKKKEQAQ